jgi:putative transposase
VTVARPRVDERKTKGQEDHASFSSTILPRFLRRTPTLEGALATLYLEGISTNDPPTASAAILGQAASGLSATTITRLKRVWEQE